MEVVGVNSSAGELNRDANFMLTLLVTGQIFIFLHPNSTFLNDINLIIVLQFATLI